MRRVDPVWIAASMSSYAHRSWSVSADPRVILAGAAPGASGDTDAEHLLCRLDHLPELRAVGVTAFHIGSAARPGGWHGSVDATAVGQWRLALDAPVPVG